MRKNRKCLACAVQYDYCPDCSGHDRLKPAWYSQFCSESCKELFNIATKFNMQLISKPEAKAAIEALELKEKSAYVECVQKDLEVILEPEVVAESILEVEQSFAPKKKQKSHEVVKKEYK